MTTQRRPAQPRRPWLLAIVLIAGSGSIGGCPPCTEEDKGGDFETVPIHPTEGSEVEAGSVWLAWEDAVNVAHVYITNAQTGEVVSEYLDEGNSGYQATDLWVDLEVGSYSWHMEGIIMGHHCGSSNFTSPEVSFQVVEALDDDGDTE